MKIVVYTCTFLDYDDVFSPVSQTPDVDFVLIADRRPRFVRGWRWRPFPTETVGMSQHMANRWCKLFPHRVFPDADASVYLDGNVLVQGDLTPLLREFLDSGAPIGLFRHSARTTVAEEAAFCLKRGKIGEADASALEAQLAAYRAAGMPDDQFLSENGVIFRRHTPETDAAMRLWWSELETRTRRDQISLPYVMHATGMPARVWNWTYHSGNTFFVKYPHAGKAPTPVRIKTQLFVRKKYGPLSRIFYGFLLKLMWGLDWLGLINMRPRKQK